MVFHYEVTQFLNFSLYLQDASAAYMPVRNALQE